MWKNGLGHPVFECAIHNWFFNSTPHGFDKKHQAIFILKKRIFYDQISVNPNLLYFLYLKVELEMSMEKLSKEAKSYNHIASSSTKGSREQEIYKQKTKHWNLIGAYCALWDMVLGCPSSLSSLVCLVSTIYLFVISTNRYNFLTVIRQFLELLFLELFFWL